MISTRSLTNSVCALSRSRACGLALAASLLLAPTLCLAVDAARPESWKLDLDVHFWLPRHEITTTSGDDLDMDIDDVVQNVDFTGQAGLKARKHRWRLYGDVFFGRVSADDIGSVTRPVGPLSIARSISAKYKEEAWIVNAAAGYNLVDDEQWTLDVFAGLRYTHLDVALSLDLKTRLLPGGGIRLEDSSDHLDGTVGVGGVIVFSDRWYARYHADIGGGDTDLTWLAQAVLAYRFDSVDAYAGWRHTEWRGIDSAVLEDLTLTGPVIGVRFKF
jgi:hypothetical protein